MSYNYKPTHNSDNKHSVSKVYIHELKHYESRKMELIVVVEMYSETLVMLHVTSKKKCLEKL